MVDSNRAFNAVLADALSKTPMQGGRIDMNDLMKNLTGRYEFDGKKVIKHETSEKPGTDRGSDA